MDKNFYNLECKNLNYFKLITLTFNKSDATKYEWDSLFTKIENTLSNVNYKYIMLVDISLVNFPGLHILKKYSELLKTYPDKIDKFCIETSIIIPQTILSKTIINTLFTIYKSRRPVYIKYSYDETYNNILKTVDEYSKN